MLLQATKRIGAGLATIGLSGAGKSKRYHKVRLFIENIGIVSSAWNVYPESFSKYKILSWFANQTSDLLLLSEACLVADLLLVSTAVLGFFYFFVVLQKDKFFVEKVLPFYKNLDFKQKILFGSFTFFVAIPNKFWINNKIHFIWVFVLSCSIYLIGLVFPLLLFCYVMYLVLCLESIIFALLYENFSYFRGLTNWVIFGASEEPFASEYFKWFWGNMMKKGSEKLAAMAAAAAAAEAQRQAENARKNVYADKQTEKADTTNQGFETPKDRAKFHGERRDEWVDENGTITKALKEAQKLKERLTGGGSDSQGSVSLEDFYDISDIGPLGIAYLIILILEEVNKWF